MRCGESSEIEDDVEFYICTQKPSRSGAWTTCCIMKNPALISSATVIACDGSTALRILAHRASNYRRVVPIEAVGSRRVCYDR